MSNLIAEYPEVAAIIVLILGFLIAKIAHHQAGRLLTLLDRLTSRYATSDATVISPDLVRMSQSAAYWVVALFSLVIALRMLGDGQFTDWIDSVLGFIPRVLVGLVIIGAGNVLGVIARFLISHLSDEMHPNSAAPRFAHLLIMTIAIVLGLQHMLIDITFITQLLLLIIILIGGALSLAFALGSKAFVANLTAQAELDRYRIGDRIRVGDVEGEIIEVSRTNIRVDSKEGIVTIPGSTFISSNVVKLHGSDHDD
jgi:small-conductance mechanosensitive channel